jgi:hypothetical protein
MGSELGTGLAFSPILSLVFGLFGFWLGLAFWVFLGCPLAKQPWCFPPTHTAPRRLSPMAAAAGPSGSGTASGTGERNTPSWRLFNTLVTAEGAGGKLLCEEFLELPGRDEIPMYYTIIDSPVGCACRHTHTHTHTLKSNRCMFSPMQVSMRVRWGPAVLCSSGKGGAVVVECVVGSTPSFPASHTSKCQTPVCTRPPLPLPSVVT